MRRVRAASDRQTSAIWNHELCGPRGVQLLTDFDGFLVAGPLCVSELFTSFTVCFHARARQGFMDDPIDVVIVTRSLNDIDRREPRD